MEVIALILCTYLFYAAHRSEGAVAKIGHAGHSRSPHRDRPAVRAQTIPCFARINWHGRNDGLAEQNCGCARGIGAIKAQLRLSDRADAHRPVAIGLLSKEWLRLEAQEKREYGGAIPAGVRA
ncbi:hypothetical protein CN163_19955 [Sinorhizobium meliloti]|nr:hypothetical protein CN163_19955 [Sinorhizobium meliloti]